jgi:hypothetical protein
MSADDYHVQIRAPNRPDAFAKLIDSLEEDDEVVWNGRDEPCTVVDVEQSASLNGIGHFEKKLVVENQNRSNGGKFRLRYEDERNSHFGLGDGTEARCRVQRHVGDDGNPNGWGRSTDIESLAHVNPIESMEGSA